MRNSSIGLMGNSETKGALGEALQGRLSRAFKVAHSSLPDLQEFGESGVGGSGTQTDKASKKYLETSIYSHPNASESSGNMMRINSSKVGFGGSKNKGNETNTLVESLVIGPKQGRPRQSATGARGSNQTNKKRRTKPRKYAPRGKKKPTAKTRSVRKSPPVNYSLKMPRLKQDFITASQITSKPSNSNFRSSKRFHKYNPNLASSTLLFQTATERFSKSKLPKNKSVQGSWMFNTCPVTAPDADNQVAKNEVGMADEREETRSRE